MTETSINKETDSEPQFDMSIIKEMYGVIYTLLFPSGKYYVGQSTNVLHRWNSYKRLDCKIKQQQYLWNALTFYGPKNVIYKIVELCNTKEDLDLKEIVYIEKYNSLENGYNLKSGGSWGKHSAATKKLMAELKIGKNPNRSKESIEKTRARWTGDKNPNYRKFGSKSHLWGKLLTLETKQKISNANSGEKNGMYGKIYSLEEKQNIKNGLNDYYKNKKWKWLYILQHESNTLVYVKCLRRFCLKNNISYRNIHSVIIGKRNKCNGWSAKREVLNSTNNTLAIDFKEFPNFLGG